MPRRTVPVTLLSDCVVVGPADEPGDRHRELVRRAHGWQSVLAEADLRLVRITDLARAAASDLRRSTQAGEAVVVQRAGPVVTRLSLVGPGRPVWSGVRALSDVADFAQRRGPRALAEATALFRPWSGLLAPTGTLRLPQGCFGTRFVVCAGPGSHSVTRWGADESESAVRAVLQGLRSLTATPYPVRGPRPREAVAAAGLSEEHWLLDGALSLLSRFATTQGVLRDPCSDAEGESRFHRMPSASCSARGETASTNELLSGLTTAALSQLSADVVKFLGRRRLRILGVRVLADPLLGEQQLAWGPVWLG